MKNNQIGNSTFLSRSRRSAAIFSLLLRATRKYASLKIDTSIGKTDDDPGAQRREFACWLRDEFIKLGPTFIKLGQIMSTRADLFHQEVVEEMAQLQDNVPPAPFEDIKSVIESELGKSLEELFVSFDANPLATASIAQIHRAVVSVDGKLVDVVVKVQRPGVCELVEDDLAVFESMAQHFFFLPRITQGSDVKGTLEELRRTFARELDYILEAESIEEFRAAFKDFSTYRVIIPGVVWSIGSQAMSTTGVLTLRYVPGTKIVDFKGSPEEVKAILKILIVAFLKQFIIDGRFHADPHPGNLALGRDRDGVYLIFYDLGMVGTLEPELRDSLLRMANRIFSQDAEGVVAECVTTGILPKEALNDKDVIDVVDGFLRGLTAQTISLDSIQDLRENLFNASERGVIAMPADFTFISRALFSLEGVFSILKESWPQLDMSSFLIPETLPMAEQVFGEPLGIFERLKFDIQRSMKIGGAVVSRGRKAVNDFEKGKLVVPVKDTDTSRAVRRLKYGVKSTNAAILFLSFFSPGILLVCLRHPIEGLVLVSASFYFLERWYFSERRMEK